MFKWLGTAQWTRGSPLKNESYFSMSKCLLEKSQTGAKLNCWAVRCKFRPRMDRTSDVRRKASRNGRIFNRQVSVGSLNQDLIGMAFSAKLIIYSAHMRGEEKLRV